MKRKVLIRWWNVDSAYQQPAETNTQ